LQAWTLAYRLQEHLQNFTTHAQHIASSYELLKDGFNQDEIEWEDEEEGCLTVKIRSDDYEKINELNNIEQSIRSLYKAMGGSLSQRAEFILQTQIEQISEKLENVTLDYKSTILESVEEYLPNLRLGEVIESELQFVIDKSPSKLGEHFFKIESSIQKETNSKEEQIGVEKVESIESKKFLFFFKRKVKKYKDKAVYKTFEYQELIIPSVEKMPDDWRDGVLEQQDSLWGEVQKFSKDYLNQIALKFSQSINRIIDLVDRTIEEQSTIAEEDFEIQVKHWQKIKEKKDAINNRRDQLRVQLDYKISQVSGIILKEEMKLEDSDSIFGVLDEQT
jgi:hypothetical protein